MSLGDIVKGWISKLFHGEIAATVEDFLKTEATKVRADLSAELDKIPNLNLTTDQKAELLDLMEKVLVAAAQAWIQSQLH